VKLLLKNLLFTCVAPGTVAGILPWLLTRDALPASGSALAVASVLFAAGGAIYSWCVWDFATFGRGTPAPIDAPVKLVVRGLYRFSRNPMYVGVLTVIAGWSVLYRAADVAVYGVFVAVAFNTFIRIYEEPHLAREFGDEYAAYRDRVGRWLPKPPSSRRPSPPPTRGSADGPRP
jgi:protein-S-isoprenylcysteine O-methyltransferase Ste14